MAEDSWCRLAKMKKNEKWLFFSLIRKFYNVFLPDEMEIIGQHRNFDLIVSYKPKYRRTVCFRELPFEVLPAKPESPWEIGPTVIKMDCDFCVMVCKDNWERGVIVDMKASYPVLKRTRYDVVAIPWAREGEFFKIFNSVGEMARWINQKIGVNDGNCSEDTANT